MLDPTPRWDRLHRYNFIKERQHGRMASNVIDFDEGSAAKHRVRELFGELLEGK